MENHRFEKGNIAKSFIVGLFSIAMLNNQRVNHHQDHITLAQSKMAICEFPINGGVNRRISCKGVFLYLTTGG